MSAEERERKQRVKVADRQFLSAVEGMCDDILASLKDEHNDDLEPWEVYQAKTSSVIHDQLSIYRERFAQGYSALLEELAVMIVRGELRKD